MKIINWIAAIGFGTFMCMFALGALIKHESGPHYDADTTRWCVRAAMEAGAGTPVEAYERACAAGKKFYDDEH